MRRDQHYEYNISLYENALTKSPRDKSMRASLAKNLWNLGLCRWSEGRYEEALAYFRRAYDEFMNIGAKFDAAKVLRLIGITQGMLGSNENAADDYQVVIKLLSGIATDKHLGVSDHEIRELSAKTFYTLSITASKLENYKEALRYVRKARRIFRELGNREYITKCLHGEAIIRSYLKEYDASNRLLMQVRPMFENQRDVLKVATVDEEIAANLHHLGCDKEALPLLDRSIEKYGKLKVERTWAFFHRARAYECIGEKDKAYSDYEKALDIVEKERGEIRAETFRKRSFAEKVHIYDHAINFCISNGLVSQAYVLVNRCKSRTFNEMLERGHISPGLGQESKLFSAKCRLRLEIDSISARVDLAEGKNQVLMKQLSAKQKEYHRLLDTISEECAGNTEIVPITLGREDSFTSEKVPPGGQVPVTAQAIDDIRNMLAGDTVLIEYYWLKTKLLIFYFSCKNLVINIVESPKLAEIVENIRYSICNSSGNSSGSQELLEWYLKLVSAEIFLSSDLIASSGIKKLLIVPHGPLHYLPFGLLYPPYITTREKRSTFPVSGKNLRVYPQDIKQDIKQSAKQNAKQLIDTHYISYLTSPQLLRILRKRKNPTASSKKCLVVADPTGDLPYATEEASAIASSLRSVDVLSGTEATKKKILSLSRNYDILHFACHAHFDEQNPIFTHLVVSDGKGGTSRLELNEIYELNFNRSPVVVLSACESGAGKLTAGDEITCLARAFIYAGARSVIVTLWPVQDRTTARLMEKFYHNLSSGQPVGEALTNAQRRLKQTDADPYHWAGFQLIGEYQ